MHPDIAAVLTHQLADERIAAADAHRAARRQRARRRRRTPAVLVLLTRAVR